MAVPAEARHHPGETVRVGQHVADSHLVKPGVPEGNDGGAASTVASLVVVVVDEDEGIAVGHEAPALSPGPARKMIATLRTIENGQATTLSVTNAIQV